MISNYAKGSIFDILLCAIMTLGISTIVFSGFYIAESQSKAYALTFVLSIIIMILMTIVSYNRKTIIIGSILMVIAVVFVILIGSRISNGNIFRDKEDNKALYFIILFICGVAIYLLSRTRLGNVILLAAGIITVCLISYMYETNQYISFILFICTCIVMQIYRNYIHNAINSQTTKVSRTSAVLSAVALMAIVVGISALVFLVVIRPLNPPHKEVKLITKYKSLQILEKVGVATESSITDPNKGSNRENNNEKDSNQRNNKGKSGTSSSDQEKKQTSKRDSNNMHAIRYGLSVPQIIIVFLIIILLITLAILIKKWLRKRWISLVMLEDKKIQVVKIYEFLLKKNAQLKIEKYPYETAYEYACRVQEELEFFDNEDFGVREITDAYIDVVYADEEPSEEIIDELIAYYNQWYLKCRVYMGLPRYILKYFIL